MMLMALPLDFCQALMAGLRPTAASSWRQQRGGLVGAGAETEVLSVTPLPRFLVKKPLFSPTRAAWVMLQQAQPQCDVLAAALLPLLVLLPEPEEPTTRTRRLAL